MSLYENALLGIYKQIRNHKISSDQLLDLPENIEKDLKEYLSCENPAECFDRSLTKEHFIFADYFLLQTEDKLDAVNHGLRYAKNKNIVSYLINNGADDFDYGLLGAIINNSMKMIKYFEDLGADDFNGAVATATSVLDYNKISYFINKGADDFSESLIVAAWNGFEELIEFYINMGADNLIGALGVGINNGYITDLLIPPFHPVQACSLGEPLLYFFKNTDFYTRSGIKINTLLPYVMRGYADKESIKLLMKLYLLDGNRDQKTYYVAFGDLPSFHKVIRKNGRYYMAINDNRSSTFKNIKKYRPGFYSQYIDKLYFSNIIELNVKYERQLPYNIEEQLWKEFIILTAIVNFYKEKYW